MFLVIISIGIVGMSGVIAGLRPRSLDWLRTVATLGWEDHLNTECQLILVVLNQKVVYLWLDHQRLMGIRMDWGRLRESVVAIPWDPSVFRHRWCLVLVGKACCLLLGVCSYRGLMLNTSRGLSSDWHACSLSLIEITLRFGTWNNTCLILLSNLCSRLLAYALLHRCHLLCDLELFTWLFRERLLLEAAIQELKWWISREVSFVNTLWRCSISLARSSHHATGNGVD
jgi:hypothetical protein